jgi:hypothetical protein
MGALSSRDRWEFEQLYDFPGFWGEADDVDVIRLSVVGSPSLELVHQNSGWEWSVTLSSGHRMTCDRPVNQLFANREEAKAHARRAVHDRLVELHAADLRPSSPL